MKTLLNGGNYGGSEIEMPDGKTKAALQSGPSEFWIYDKGLNPATAQSDFVGMASTGDAVLDEPTTVVIDMQG